MSKKIIFSKEAREALKKGVDQLANAVTSTLGPSGRNVIIEEKMGNPISTKDGVTVAKAVELDDEIENIGAQIVKQTSIKTADSAGDGTTTSTLLAQTIFNQGLEQVANGVNAVDINRGIQKATALVVDNLVTEYSKEITDEEQLEQIATISANNDEEIGKLISTAFEKVGTDGVVSLEESKTGETFLETVEGMQFNRGYKSPYFVTDNNSMSAVLQNPYILITDSNLTKIKELLPLLENISQQNRSLLIIADDIGGEALSTLVVNKMRGILSCVAVKAPDFGDRKKAIMEDIAILTGGQVVSSEKGMRLDKFDLKWLGEANKVTVEKESTTIIDALGEEEAITNRVEVIQSQIDQSVSPYEKEILQDRLAKFVGGVAIVNVGGITELEMKERKARVEDALFATKAAMQEGFLPGGGIALLNSAQYLVSKMGDVVGEEQIGMDIVIKACEEPFYKILENAGYDNDTIGTFEQRIVEEGDLWYGYNSRTDNFVNMFKEGIIDPTKVTRLALENAASIAGTMLTTEAVISNTKDDSKKDPTEVDPSMFM